jgi:hypothetical protein
LLAGGGVANQRRFLLGGAVVEFFLDFVLPRNKFFG